MADRPESAANTWTIEEASERLEEIIERAHQVGPQLITRNGKPAVYVVSPEDWRRRKAGLPLVHEEQEAT